VFLYEETVPTTNAVLGQALVLSGSNADILKSFFKHSSEWEPNLANLRANIKQLTLNYEEVKTINIEMRQGVHIIIPNSHEVFSDKLQLAYSVYESDEMYRTQGIILIVKRLDGIIEAMYDDGQ
jgi:hypothetical protein